MVNPFGTEDEFEDDGPDLSPAELHEMVVIAWMQLQMAEYRAEQGGNTTL